MLSAAGLHGRGPFSIWLSRTFSCLGSSAGIVKTPANADAIGFFALGKTLSQSDD